MAQGSRPSTPLKKALLILAATGCVTAIAAARQARAQDPLPPAQPLPSALPTSEPAPSANPTSSADLLPPPQTPSWIARPDWNAQPPATEDLPPLPVAKQRARRTHVFLNPGYLFSMTPAVASKEQTYNGRTTMTDVATGHGLELSVAVWPARSLFTYGAFTQLQRYISDNGYHNRYALGGQFGWMMFYFEGGIAYREADEKRRGTGMLHLGPGLSLAFLNIGARIGVPLLKGTDTQPVHHTEVSLVMAVKIPILLF